MNLSDYVRVLREQWLLIALFTVLGLAAAAAASLLSQPTYRATTLVYVAVRSTGEVADLVQGGSFAQNQVKTFAGVVSQPIVVEPVLAELDLEETAQKFGESISATVPIDTSNIEIAVERTTAQEAADIANAVTASFQEVVAKITAPSEGGPSPITVTVVRPATVPEEPASPRVAVNLAMGAVIGLVAGFLLAVLRELLSREGATPRLAREPAILGEGAPAHPPAATSRDRPASP